MVDNNRNVNWVVGVRNLFGFEKVWYHQGGVNKALFIRTCKQWLCEQYIQQWLGALRDRAGCRLYREIKTAFVYSEYLNAVRCYKWRTAFTRFRTRNHSLSNVKMGQGHLRVPYNERLCVDCGVLGDEYHCVFECRKTEHLRHILPVYYYMRRPSMAKFIELLTTTRASELNKLAKFLYMADL